MAMGMSLHLLWWPPGANDIDGFLNSLPQAEAQVPWKKFEYNRMASLSDQEQANFDKIARGPGCQMRKRNLLNAWLVAGKDSSCKSFQDHARRV